MEHSEDLFELESTGEAFLTKTMRLVCSECKTEVKDMLPHTMIFAIGPFKQFAERIRWKPHQFCEKCGSKYFEYDDKPGQFVLLVKHQ